MKSLLKIKTVAGFLVALSLMTFSLMGNAATAVKTGEFSGANDHITTGQVSLVQTPEGYAVVLGSDFSLDGAPDPKVGLGKNGQYDPKALLGKLISHNGQSAYIIPASVDVNNFDEVFIWCDQFSVSLGSAKIK
ncbi:DM13 domain-containing protein [Psychromonas sp. SP041]|uniref:DM13 domain-containing protein n=1 Tax=Psychromonas sp. SP041 TaxID=1365007 RepID=UPI0010C7B386|nr:DM13 domain-containing protein [Psychromonas sp. SP041]